MFPSAFVLVPRQYSFLLQTGRTSFVALILVVAPMDAPQYLDALFFVKLYGSEGGTCMPLSITELCVQLYSKIRIS
jgi:hypothetical protein